MLLRCRIADWLLSCCACNSRKVRMSVRRKDNLVYSKVFIYFNLFLLDSRTFGLPD